MNQPVFTLQPGSVPLLVSMPHIGTALPAAMAPALADAAAQLDDTDWHIDRLYACAAALGASVLRPHYSRYVIDLNRPPDDASLYPGLNTTGLCPTTTFDGVPLYHPGKAPDEETVAQRRDIYWRPYHAALRDELARLRAAHGYALLWDAHSIRSRVPRLFDGELPLFNFGTANGASCAGGIAQALLDDVRAALPQQSAVLNGRFKGGYITRSYGMPNAGVHAIQLELAQRGYMDETPPYAYDEQRAQQLQPVLERLLQRFLDWRPAAT